MLRTAADEDPYAPLLRRIMRDSDSEASGGDMFALFARRESMQAARVLSDLDRLLSVWGAQARCLECPSGPARASAAEAASGRALLRLFARSLVD